MENKRRRLVALMPLLTFCMLVFCVRISNEIAIAPSTLGGAIINAGKFTNSLRVSVTFIDLMINRKDKWFLLGSWFMWFASFNLNGYGSFVINCWVLVEWCFITVHFQIYVCFDMHQKTAKDINIFYMKCIFHELHIEVQDLGFLRVTTTVNKRELLEIPLSN